MRIKSGRLEILKLKINHNFLQEPGHLFFIVLQDAPRLALQNKYYIAILFPLHVGVKSVKNRYLGLNSVVFIYF